MLRDSMCAMNRLDISWCLCSSSNHGALAYQQNRARRDGRRAADPEPLTGEASFAEEVARAEHRDYGFTTSLRQHRQLDASRLDVQHVLAQVALGEDDAATRITDGLLLQAAGLKERVCVEGCCRRRAGG